MNCQTHKQEIVQVCLKKGCDNHLLCQKCLIIHPTDHTSEFVEKSRVFDSDGKVILMSRTYDNLKQRVNQTILNLKSQQIQLTDEIENLTFDFQRRLQAYLDEKLKQYKSEIRKFYHQLQNSLYTEQKKLQKVRIFPDDPYDTQINHFNDFKNQILRKVIDEVESVEFKAGQKQQAFISKSNYDNSYNRITQTIDQHPFVLLKVVNDIPFEQQCIQALSIQNKFYEHKDWINKLCYLDSNQIFASASSDSTIRVFDLNTDSEIAKMEGHIGAINTLLFWDETTLISGGLDKTIRVWDWQVQTDEQQTVLYGHDKPVRALVKLDEDLFASGGGERQVHIWSFQSKKLVKKLPECEDTILCLAKLHGDYMASGSSKGIITIYDYQRLNGNIIKFLTIHSGAVKSMLYMKDEQRLITGGDDNQIYIIKYMQVDHPYKLQGHKGGVTSLIYLNSPTFFGSAGWDGQIMLWDIEKREEVLSIQENENYIQSVIYMNDGKTLISGGSDQTIRVWTMKAQATLEELSMQLQSFANINENLDNSQNGIQGNHLETPRQGNCEVCNIF
ncbi:WD domain, G-beta repeat protein (macronuclear) [Tetrahymena thermophila SB210]|uniref:WD domain, G-beta repeat protein n=1 Tax=Tetrahymena thermophila (strain SB210) TaxID=312017 RepID=I7LZV3_TETTS|nr:WD domain, G-beta repeat protein [Tetrahymena thermophila SB210]EAR84978.2 WD domain, G-beta repeat protein [Tetrahymena thermophila SB210]|eukprot:XP_001032641.2 WD domain, G-beta repeat protein [Tetrahymena thermophila SB210]